MTSNYILLGKYLIEVQTRLFFPSTSKEPLSLTYYIL